MTELEKHLYDALKRITKYDSPAKLRRQAERDYGLSGEEAMEYAYENIRSDAKEAIRGLRRTK